MFLAVQTIRKLVEPGNAVLKISIFNFGDLKLKRIPNSVDTFAPNNRFVKAINTIPITPGIRYHTIVGDRGKGDAPNSSDGVLPYWSSHMEGAQSELIVPSGHPAHQNPQTIEEVRHILKLMHVRPGGPTEESRVHGIRRCNRPPGKGECEIRLQKLQAIAHMLSLRGLN
jgi:hypothetical protein